MGGPLQHPVLCQEQSKLWLQYEIVLFFLSLLFKALCRGLSAGWPYVSLSCGNQTLGCICAARHLLELFLVACVAFIALALTRRGGSQYCSDVLLPGLHVHADTSL